MDQRIVVAAVLWRSGITVIIDSPLFAAVVGICGQELSAVLAVTVAVS